MDNQKKSFWKAYSEDHFWRLNDKSQVKEKSDYYDMVYDTLLPQDTSVQILDIGCGGGHFLHYLSRKGYTNIQGIDIASGLVDFVRAEICPNVLNADALEYLSEHPNQFDVLAANDFIEHLPKESIIKFLELCRKALRPNGMLILKTPNMSHPLAGRNRYVDFTHETGFTEHSLYQVCAAAGFESINLYGEFHAVAEPRFYRWIKKLYREVSETSPQVLSANLLAVCKKGANTTNELL